MHHQNNSSFSMLFSMPNQYRPYDQYYHQEVMPSSVDCTLSLGTPSTRLTDNDVVPGDGERRARQERRSGSCVTNFCWDLLQPKHHHNQAAAPAANHQKNGSRGGSNNGGGANNIDPLLARRCANCDTTSTPLWRNGPRGPKSLCNACGIRFKKEERRATAAAAHGGGSAVIGMDPNNNHVYSHHNNSWIPHAQPQKLPCYSPNEFRFMEDDTAHHENDTNGIPFLSWRLNVTDRPGLVHDFTR